MYVPLHNHFENGTVGFSLLNIKDAVKKFKISNIKAAAVTDTMSLSAIMYFYNECISNNIKPLIGMEAIIKDNDDMNYTLTLIAKNKVGYSNLLYLHNYSYLNNINYIPEDILIDNSSDLVILSDGNIGRIPLLIKDNIDKCKSILNYKYDEIIKILKEYKKIFKDFYLELYPGLDSRTIKINLEIAKISKMTDIDLVVTGNSYFLDERDHKEFENYLKLNRSNKLDKNSRYKYLMNYEEVIKYFYYLDDNVLNNALNNTVKIAESIEKYNISIKANSIPIVNSNNEVLSRCMDKLRCIEITLTNPILYYQRLQYELKILEEKGYINVLMLIADIVKFADENNIMLGPGRGSVNGALTAYLLGITKVDPIKYNLSFERFVSKERNEKADIDIDVSTKDKPKIIQYIINKYGQDYCCLLSSYDRRKIMSSFEDSAKLFEIDENIKSKVLKIVSDNRKYSIEEILENKLKYFNCRCSEWFNTALKIYNKVKTRSLQSSGIIISRIPVANILPMNYMKNNLFVTSFDGKSIDNMNLLKYDFLNSNVLEVISDTCNDVGITINYSNDNFFEYSSNIGPWDLISSQYTTTLFQISSNLYKERLYKIKPRSIEDLAKCLALVRTPCVKAGLDKKFINISTGIEHIEKIYYKYDVITEYTNGILLYQEDLIKLLNALGFHAERSFQIMKLAAKKDVKEINAIRDEFVSIAYKNDNISLDIINKLWNIIVNVGSYLLNKNHAVAYAIFTYITAYLKYNYYLIWMKNILNNYYFYKKNVDEVINELKTFNVKILSIDLAKSDWNFSIEENNIRIGFIAVRGVTPTDYNILKNTLCNNDFISYIKNLISNKINIDAIVASIFIGAYDNIFHEDYITLYNKFCCATGKNILEDIRIDNSVTFNINNSINDIRHKLLNMHI